MTNDQRALLVRAREIIDTAKETQRMARNAIARAQERREAHKRLQLGVCDANAKASKHDRA